MSKALEQLRLRVTRWAELVRLALIKEGLDPALYGAGVLGHIHSESGGNPSNYLESNGGFGLGGAFQWVDGKRYKGPADGGKYWVHPDAKIGPYDLSWDPHDQIGELVGLWAQNLRSAGGHQPSASHAYASGPGNMRKLMGGWEPTGNVRRQHLTYIPTLYREKAPWYWAWWQDWEAAGTPTRTETIHAGKGDEGGRYRVSLAVQPQARSTAPSAAPLAFDGFLRWKGDVYAPPLWARWRDGGGPDPVGLRAAADRATDAIKGGLSRMAALVAAGLVAMAAWRWTRGRG